MCIQLVQRGAYLMDFDIIFLFICLLLGKVSNESS